MTPYGTLNRHRDPFYAPFLTEQRYFGKPWEPPSVGVPRPAGDGRDRLNELPDEILRHILSFLTTKSAVKTCVLSKRWARLWASVPALRFTQWEFPNVPRFVAFVERALSLRDPSDIRRFELQWHHGFDPSWLREWVDHAMRHNASELVLNVPPKGCVVSVGHLVCQSLEELVLDVVEMIALPPDHGCTSGFMSFTAPNLLLPSSISKLRTLHLLNVMSHPELGHFISNCPSLEDLMLRVSCFNGLSASAPNLKRFSLHCKSIAKCQGAKVQVLAPRLSHLRFHFFGDLPELCLGDLQSLEDACICTSVIQDGDETKLAQILGALFNAKALRLEGNVIESLAKVQDLSKHAPPSFSELKYLKMEALLNEDNIRVMAILLRSFPNLEKLVVQNSKGGRFRPHVGRLDDMEWMEEPVINFAKKGKFRMDLGGLDGRIKKSDMKDAKRVGFQSDVSRLQDDWITQERNCHSNLYHLKEVEINGFLGAADEVELVNLLLRNASKLQRLKLNYMEEAMNHESWTSDYGKLLAIPRASPTANISFCTVA